MRRSLAACLRTFFCAATLALIVTGTAAAQNQPPKALPDKPQAEPVTPRIEIDKDEGVLRILTGGTERVTIDADGLHVKGSIEYMGSLTDISDARLKADIRPLAPQQEALLSLRPVAFTMADDPQNTTEYGLLAQEVEPIYPALVETRSDGAKAVNYTGLIAPLIAAVQELHEDNARLRARVEALEAGAQ